jgi:hypothetical protein
VAHAALATDNRGDGYHVIGIRGVAHAKEKAENDDGD